MIRRSAQAGGAGWLVGWLADYLMIMAHEAMPRWAMDPFIIPWDGPRNLTLSNISRAPVKRGPLRRGGRLLLAGADKF